MTYFPRFAFAMALLFPATVTADVPALERLVETNRTVCETKPAQRCIDAGWAFADTNRDGVLDLGEIQRLRRLTEHWATTKGKSLPPRQQGAILMGLMLVDSAGLPTLFANYDLNGDGRLTQAELFADVKLDNRPLPWILADRDAVDLEATRVKLGALGPLLDGMMARR